MTDLHITGAPSFEHLMQEVEAEIQDTKDFILPDEMVVHAVERACEFFHLPEVPIVNSEGSCVWPNDPRTPFDDVFGFNRTELMELGIRGEDSLTLIYTHECAHRALQSYPNLDPWEHELACDFFAGIHAGMKEIDTDNFEEALGGTHGSVSHPAGSLRSNFIEYGKEIAEEMQARHIPITFEGCLERFNMHLIEEEDNIAQCRQTADCLITPKNGEEHPLGLTNNNAEYEKTSHENLDNTEWNQKEAEKIANDSSDQISFCGKYSEAEISKLKYDVERAQSEVNTYKHKVDDWASKVNLNNTKEHKANGDYEHARSCYNKAVSQYNEAQSRLKDAQVRLNNAI